MFPNNDPCKEWHTRLSPSQVRMVKELAQGKTPEQIAAQRGIRRDTVYATLEEARKRLGARTSYEMVAIATKRRLLDSDDPGSGMRGEE